MRLNLHLKKDSVEIGTYNVSKQSGDFIAIYVKRYRNWDFRQVPASRYSLPFIQESSVALIEGLKDPDLVCLFANDMQNNSEEICLLESELGSGSTFTLRTSFVYRIKKGALVNASLFHYITSKLVNFTFFPEHPITKQFALIFL